MAIEFVKPGTPEAESVERVLLKETVCPNYLPTAIVAKVKAAGFVQFEIYDHTQPVDRLNARNSGKGYGVDVAGKWYWYEGWFEKVMERLEEGWSR